MGQTPRRTIRVPDRVWNAATRKAAAHGLSVSKVINVSLERWVKRDGKGKKRMTL